MKVSRFAPALCLLALAACTQGTPTATAPAAAKPVAVVNGTPISKDMMDLVAKSQINKNLSDLTVQQRGELVDGVIRAEAVAQQAVKDKLDKAPEAAAELELSRLQLLQGAAAEAFFKSHPVTDAELRAEYDEQVKALPKLQYLTRHVLVKTEPEARAIIKQLEAGKPLSAFAKQSLDPGSRDKGGQLGWLSSSDSLVKEFIDAMLTLKKGEFTREPVKSSYGYHVIAVDDTRDYVPPPFDSVKDSLKQIVQRKMFKAYGEDLVKKAKVTKNID